MNHLVNDDIRNSVRQLYGKIADGTVASCCNTESSCCSKPELDHKARSVEIGYSDKVLAGPYEV